MSPSRIQHPPETPSQESESEILINQSNIAPFEFQEEDEVVYYTVPFKGDEPGQKSQSEYQTVPFRLSQPRK